MGDFDNAGNVGPPQVTFAPVPWGTASYRPCRQIAYPRSAAAAPDKRGPINDREVRNCQDFSHPGGRGPHPHGHTCSRNHWLDRRRRDIIRTTRLGGPADRYRSSYPDPGDAAGPRRPSDHGRRSAGRTDGAWTGSPPAETAV